MEIIPVDVESNETEKDVRLIPFTVQSFEEKVDFIPPGVEMIDAPDSWELGWRGDGVVIAVLDTGVEKEHPDLRDRIIDGRNFTHDGEADDYQDFNGHGTHVAGTIAASSNGDGITGVAPNAKLLILKVLDAQGTGYYSWITEAVKYATKWTGPNGEKVRIISMSLGGPAKVNELRDAIIEATKNNIAVVCAAGNEGDDDDTSFEYSYPSGYNEVISVSAATPDLKIAPFSNNNEEVDIIAPGVDVLSTWPGKTYARISGTSMATPHIAGALALLLQFAESEEGFNRKMTEAEMYALLVERTVALGYKKSSEGHGFVRLTFMNRVRDLLSYVEQNF
ncbi:S8 family peptidase [Neobacillus niacini]|uniref:S8 family peptidase n=1 Tax=Neobacillus niacini TaxID=86668 RepID=UPI002FFF7BAD